MISNLFWVESAILTALLYFFNHDTLSLWWLLPILLGFYLALTLLFLVFAAIAWLFIPKKVPERPNAFARITVRHAAIWVTRMLGTHIRLRGEKRNSLPDEPTVFICNHRTALDPFFIIRAFPHHRLGILSKDSVRKYPIIGDYMNAAGCAFVDRSSPLNALRAIRTATKFVEGGLDYVVFPEGTRSRTGELLPFKSGAFVLAKKANTPIVVLTMQGAQKATKYLPFRGPRITLTVEEVIPADKVAELSGEELAEYTYGIMKASLDRQSEKK